MRIRNGSDVFVNGNEGDAVVGMSPSPAGGIIETTGAGSTFSTGKNLTIGKQGSGELSVSQGGEVTTNSFALLAEMTGSSGTATVSGAGSKWTVKSVLNIGSKGRGSLSVEGGATVASAGGTLSEFSSGTADASVNGQGSTWVNTGDLVIAERGGASLQISNGASVANAQGAVGRLNSAAGGVFVGGVGSTWSNSGARRLAPRALEFYIFAGGSVSCTSAMLGAVSGFGNVTVRDGGSPFKATWTISQSLAVGGPSTLDVQHGGQVSVMQETTIGGSGSVKLTGGEFGTAAINFQSGGQFQWTSGTLHVGTYHGSLTNPNGGVLAPGNSPGSTLILGDYTQQSTAVLEIEIGGVGQGTQFDFVNVTGTAILDGELRLKLINGFVPSPTQSFVVMSAASLLGVLDNAGNGQTA